MMSEYAQTLPYNQEVSQFQDATADDEGEFEEDNEPDVE